MDGLSLAPPKKKRQRPELGIQRGIIGFIARCAPGVDVRAIPNDSIGGQLKMRRRGEGVIAGTPDLVCVCPEGVTVWLEVKAPGGVLSPAQKDTHASWRAKRHHVHLVRSIEDAEDALRTCGVHLFGTADPVRSLKRRGWESAYALKDRAADLTEDERARVLAADKAGPEKIHILAAEAMVRLAERVMGKRT